MLKKRFPSLSSLGSDGNTSFLRAARAGNLDKVLEHLKNNIDINTCNANGLNALHLASKDGHIHVVSELLKRGAIVDSATKKGNTALHIASLAGQEDVVKLLLHHNASVNVQSQNGFTPLYMAAQENHDSVVKLLLANGANQSLATEDGFTPLAVAMQQGHDKVVAVLLESDTRGKVRLPALHIAAKKDDVKAATLLLENDHNPDVTSKSGFTPLHIASHYGNESIANLLIQKGADVNYAAKHNISPLHVAAKWGKTNMVSLLLEKGANIESKTRDGLTPLHCAARSGHEQVVDMLLERGAPISAKTKNGLAPLHMAAQGEHVDAARILLYHRAPVDEVTVDYLTALHVAAHCGHVRVAKLLLDRNADANARALNGFTPLHIACKKNRIKVVELLLKHGASISATTESGLTPLHVASFMGCMNIVIYLLQHEAKVDVPTVRGETPLHLAARANQTDIIRILLRNNAQVDARAREQQTPLHIASRLGNVDIVMLLLQHGAQVDATTKDMYTALHIAAKEGQDEVAASLIENGASLDATTKKGFTPLHLAGKYGHMKVAQLLLQKDAAIDAQGKNGVTPLHVAGHYDHQNVALLLLEKGASPHATAKNGNTPLHIAARKNQMDIATTLLEYGAKADAESKAGFTPLHLSAQEGHTDMSSLLLEHKAGCDHQARNGLTPLHLCAQEDKVNVAQVLVKNGANIEKTTKAGYTPLHVAAHFGQANMVRFLLQNGANVDAATGIGYTPLHQAAQQGHCHIVNLLLEHKANANAQTANGQTPLHIARKLGYISVLDSLKSITNEMTSPTQTPQTEEKYRVVAPEAMHETFMTDSEEEGDEDTVICNQHYQYLTADEMKSLGDDSLPIDVTRDERMDSNRMIQSTESTGQPPQALEDIISPQHAQVHSAIKPSKENNYVTDNVMVERHAQHVGFLVSFLVDARGGAMRGCRHSGVRIIVPARSASQPTRITCRYVKPQRTMHPPQLMEGEALASRVLELGPIGSKFLGPVVMEVPHFASLRGKEREIVILRSDNGETWREHTIDNSDEVIHDVLNECFEAEEINQLDELGGGRICRFVTYDFPQYFAVVSRIRQEVHAIGPEGGMVSSTVVPQVQAVFPQGALTKKIKVGLQAQPIEPELTAKLLGRGVAVSPIVTVEPRRRKFHKAITLSMPAPKAHSQGMINQYSGNAPTLRLLCSITGGPSRAQWEDVTGSTPLTFVNDCVSFTTTVSARFWLMDCRNISDATKMATELYREAIHVPFMAKFVVFAKRVDPTEARLRVFCMTDDKEDKTLEQQEHFAEVAKSRDVEVLEGKSQYIEMAGNLVPVTKSGDQLQLTFKAFRENRLPFSVRVKDQHADTIGRTLFMREPKVAKGEPPQQPICILNIALPDTIIPDQISLLSGSHEFLTKGDDYNYLGDLRIVDISNLLGEDWINLAAEIGISQEEINTIKAQHPTSTAQQAQSMLRLFKMMKPNDRNILENGLRVIGRNDIIRNCIKITSYIETSRIDHPGERKHVSLDNGYDEADIMKDSESVEELVLQEDQRIQQMRERDELKYSAEEKIVEDSESDDENIKRSVAERREKIVKRLSIERQIPASTQKKEIVQEITEIKRKSLIEDKKAIHEEEIMLQMPTDNIIKSAVVSDQIIKLKTNKIETPDVSKTDFDKELQDKFKKTVKLVNDEIEEDFTVASSKIIYDSTVTEKSTKIHQIPSNIDQNFYPTTIDEAYQPSKLDKLLATKISSIDESIPMPVVEIIDKSKESTIETFKTVETIKMEEITKKNEAIISKKEEVMINKEETLKRKEEQSIEKEEILINQEKTAKRVEIEINDTMKMMDEDLEQKLSKQKEKIEKRTQEISENVQNITEMTITESDQFIEDFMPKNYSEKPRESLTEAEFYKSIEETITKKMSEGLIQINDDILSSISKEIPESQTPPPTPIDIQSQKDGKYESPESLPEELAEAIKVDDNFDDESVSERTKADIDMIRKEALELIDSIIEQSLMIVSAQQCNDTYNSESENYAITCDVNGIDMVKSPTIESLSGKSFDDNLSVNEENHIFTIPCTTTTTVLPTTPPTSIDNKQIIDFNQCDQNDLISTINDNNNYSDCIESDSNQDDQFNKKNFDRIERKFERLSSQLDDIDEGARYFDKDFDNLLSRDDISNLQSDFSKISWDESVSGTTTAPDVGLSTPDNDLQDLPTEPGSQTIPTDSEIPKPTPRTTRTVVSEVSKKVVSTEIESEDLEKKTKGILQDVDFKQSKKFWESLESSQSELQSQPPIPRPRMQVKLSDDSGPDSLKDSSQDSKISSERQVEYSESSSLRTSLNEDKLSREEDTEISDVTRLEDETFPGTDLDKSEPKSSEDVLIKDITRLEHEPSEDTDEDDQEIDQNQQARFYIGESSTNIITKSTTEKRNEFAFDNKGYEGQCEETEKTEDFQASDKVAFTEIAGRPQVEFDIHDHDAGDDEKDEFEEMKPYVLSIDIPESKTFEDDKNETKFFRHDSETRNDILETACDQTEPEKPQQSSLGHVYFEDQTIPKPQEVVKEEISAYAAQVHKSKILVTEELHKKEQHTESEQRKTRTISTIELKESVIAQKDEDSIKDIDTTKTEPKVKFESKLELNLEKSELELSEKSFTKVITKREDIVPTSADPKVILSPIKPFKGFPSYQETTDEFKKSLLIDPSQVDQSIVDQTLAEVKESLDAVQEELIEVVKDGKLIKQSPSEFEFKLLPHIKYTTDPIQECHQEDIDKQEKPLTEDLTSISSADDSSSKGEVIHRLKKEHKTDTLNRWSVHDLDHSSSGDSHYQSFEKTDSRPISSDIENLMTYGNSSEYQTALDASLLPESTEYASAVSTFDHSGKTISSHESMKSLDSESSANLGSIEVSEMSETLVPSITDPDIENEIQDEDFDADDNEMKLSSFENKFCGVLMEDYQKTTDGIPSQMKRSQEMTFQPEIHQESIDSMNEKLDNEPVPLKFSTSLEESRTFEESRNIDEGRTFEESKFPSSFEEGSILSMSLSSASCIDTVVENVEDLASSLGASSLAGSEIFIRDDYTGTSFEEPSKSEKIDSMVMTSSLGRDEETNYANTQITTVTVSAGSESGDSEMKRKGHKRNESTAFSNADFLKEIAQSKGDYTVEEEKVEDEAEPRTETKVYHEEKKDSESESDYDTYESEYSRAFKTPSAVQKKPKDKLVETFEKDQEPEKQRPFTPSQSVSEPIIEDATEEIETIKTEEISRRPSQNMHDYSNIPDIMITEDLQKYIEDDDDFQDNILYKVKTQEDLDKADDTPIHYAQEQIFSVTEDQYQDLIEKEFESNLADITRKYAPQGEEDKADSPDSFEMLEQPDISDEFVIIEEVAKEADEFDTEGKSICIKNVKYVKKHDDEVEQILVKSAPAAPNEGSAMYMRDDLNFEFEESPPTDPDKDSDSVDTAAASKRWVEMQLSDNAAHLRYPYEMERGMLEDIKEEDTDFEVGSSRISSFKDSFSSTPEYDVLAGRKYFTREHDDISMSSLQEFESLEQAISLENRRAHQGSQDSLSNGSFTKRYMARSAGQGDDISLSSLKEFEGLENACLEAHLIEIKAKEEAALLSRSDESNKSGNGDPKSSSTAFPTVPFVTNLSPKSSSEKVPVKTQQEIDALLRAKLDECDEEISNVMEVSTDSLELALKKSKSQNDNGNGKDDSQLGSCDSLEINKSADIMTSSIDSFEISKDATARSSRSDVDSLEQQILQDVRRDSIDSIELEYAKQVTKMDGDSLEENIKGQSSSTAIHSTIVQGPIQINRTILTTTTVGSFQSEMIKDISSDSLNLNRTESELLLSSTGSLDRTSSTATNATYQNENDSLMSGSMTSCGSNTLIDTLESNFTDIYQGASTSTSTTTTSMSQITIYDDNTIQQYRQQQQQSNKDEEKCGKYAYFEIFEKDNEKFETNQTETGEYNKTLQRQDEQPK